MSTGIHRITTGGARVRVEEVEDIQEKGSECSGLTEELFNVDGDDWLIRIRQDLSPRAKALTLLHELLHVVDESHALGLGERKIRGIEQAVSALCRLNPDTMRTLFLDLCSD